MAIIRKTMEQIRMEMTPERMAEMSERLKHHIDEYDPENPPLTDEELSKFRRRKDIPPDIEIIARARAAEAKMKLNELEHTDNEDINPKQVA